MIKTLNSIEEALTYITSKDGVADQGFVVGADLKFLEIEIDGKLFHGDITGELARGLAELQDELYRAARFAITGKEGRESRLSKENKDLLELQIEVRKGCTLLKIDIGHFSDGLLKILGDQVGNMSSGEVQLLVLGALAILAVGWIGKNALVEHLKSKADLAKGAQENVRLSAVIDGQIKIVNSLGDLIDKDKRLERFADASAAGLTQVAIRATDATRVKLGPTELNEDDLAVIRKRNPRSASETLHETGDFRILEANGNVNPFKLVIGGAAIPGEFTVEYDKTEFTSVEDDLIWSALKNRDMVRLEIKAEQLRGKIKGAVIVNINPRA